MDLKQVEIVDDIDVEGWLFQSSVNPEISYELESHESADPIDYFDYRQRHIVRKVNSQLRRQKTKQGSTDKSNEAQQPEELKFAFCFHLSPGSADLKEAFVADLQLTQALSKQFKGKVNWYEDVCVELRDEGMDVALIHSKPITVPSQYEKKNCILQQLEDLLAERQLVNLLVDILAFLVEMTDEFFYEFEVENFNILTQKSNNGYSFKLVNQVLPIFYQIEFHQDLCDIYEEERVEFNSRLVLKKVAFLLITVAREESVDEYRSVRELYEKHSSHPDFLRVKSQVQTEIFKVAMTLVDKIEKNEEVYLENVIDWLEQANESVLRSQSHVKSVKSDKKNEKMSWPSQKSRGLDYLKSPSVEVEIFEQGDDDEEEDDYYCVPAIDHETLKLKIKEENEMRQSKNMVVESETDLKACQSIRSLDMLVGSSQVMIRKYEEPNMEGGQTTIVNVNQNRSQSKKILKSQNSQGMQSARLREEKKEPSDRVGLNSRGTNQLYSRQGTEDMENNTNGNSSPGNIKMKMNLIEEGDEVQYLEPGRKKDFKEPDLSKPRDRANFRNFINTQSLVQAHFDAINCVTDILIEEETLKKYSGHFFKSKEHTIKGPLQLIVTGSQDKTIKFWRAFNHSPTGLLQEEFPVTHFIRSQKEALIIYICGNSIKSLNILSQKAVQLFRNDTPITSVTRISLNQNIISFGTANGMIKDFDTHSKCIIRRAGNIHNGSKVTAMTSRGKFLASASEDGYVIVYDYANQQEYKELNCTLIGLQCPSSLLFLTGEKYLVIGEASGLTIVDVDSSQVVSTIPCKDTTKLIGLPQVSDLDGQRALMSCQKNGQLRLWKESTSETRFLDLIKALKCNEEVSDAVSLPNGAIVSCGGHQRNLQIWEEKIVPNSCAGNSCCSIF